jgi:hypothetical protein
MSQKVEKQIGEQQQMLPGHPISKWKEQFRQAEVPLRTLADGRQIPALGLGTLNMAENEVGDIVRQAIQHGYRLIDTSPVYGNEKAIGEALLSCM